MLEDQSCQPSPGEISPTRRRALGVFGASGLALVASSTPASAFFWKKKASASIDLSRLPVPWINRQARYLNDYADFLASLKLRRVSPQLVIEAHAKRRGLVWNSLPPKSLWKNMAPTLKVVDRLAAEIDQPVKEIVSAYRSPAYNARCSGAKRGSWHKANVAVDVKFPIRSSVVSSNVRSLRSRGLFKGGVGHYYSFTHIDTRGQSVDW
ncbi:D-Ala-D-Ala carboxypeptidase family metallohydrolase [Haloferula sp.]|uniref:D-Ala-D-Ala carboxypeptidase family metallohydrolase n=1 Tax=Haloferula sp. TaxID=2497595 RepID=UPI00329A9829